MVQELFLVVGTQGICASLIISGTGFTPSTDSELRYLEFSVFLLDLGEGNDFQMGSDQ